MNIIYKTSTLQQYVIALNIKCKKLRFQNKVTIKTQIIGEDEVYKLVKRLSHEDLSILIKNNYLLSHKKFFCQF